MIGGGWGPPPVDIWNVWIRYVAGNTVYKEFTGEYGPAAEEADRARKRTDVAKVYLLFCEEDIVRTVWTSEGRRVVKGEE